MSNPQFTEQALKQRIIKANEIRDKRKVRLTSPSTAIIQSLSEYGKFYDVNFINNDCTCDSFMFGNLPEYEKQFGQKFACAHIIAARDLFQKLANIELHRMLDRKTIKDITS